MLFRSPHGPPPTHKQFQHDCSFRPRSAPAPPAPHATERDQQPAPRDLMPAVPSTSTYVPSLLATYPIRRSARACERCRRSKASFSAPRPASRPSPSRVDLPSVSQARCDGPEAWPCRRCRESGVECVFEGVNSAAAPPKAAAPATGSAPAPTAGGGSGGSSPSG